MKLDLVKYITPLVAGAGISAVTFGHELRKSGLPNNARDKFDFLGGNDNESKFTYLSIGAGLWLSDRTIELIVAIVGFIAVQMYRQKRFTTYDWLNWVTGWNVGTMNWWGVAPQAVQILALDYLSFKDGGETYMDIVKADKNVDALIHSAGLGVIFGILNHFKLI